MRALLTVFGSRGDVQPMLALAHGLSAAGHEATIAAPPVFGPWVEAAGVRFLPIGGDLDALLREIGKPSALKLFREAIRAQFALVGPARGCDVMVGGPLVPSFASVADAAGVPFVAALFSPQWLPSRHHGPPTFLSPSPAWSKRFDWWFVRAAWNLLFRPLLNRERATLGLGPVTDAWSELIREGPLLAADEALAPLPADVPAGVVRTGAWILDEAEELDPSLLEFLAAGPPPVYVGFGSMVDRDPARTGELIVRALEGAGVRGLISSGWAKLTAARLPPTIRVIGPTPHSRLFPRCSLVVHHGGAGTMAAAARAGVPQLFVPHGADQFQWARWARDAGLAHAPLLRPRLSSARLQASLVALLADEKVRARARELSRQLTSDGVARAVRHLESVVAGRPGVDTGGPAVRTG